MNQKDQLESLWNMVTQLGPLAAMVEDIQISIKDTIDKISDLENKYGQTYSDEPKKENPEGYSRVLTPLSHFPNGDVTNRGEAGGEVNFRKSILRSLSSSGLVPVEEHKFSSDSYNKKSLDKSSSWNNVEWPQER